MNAGKSEGVTAILIQLSGAGEYVGVVYTAEIDNRFGAGKVSSRIGLSSPAKAVTLKRTFR
ncbi:hypothetical protein ACNKHS_07290 [Shigella flexneri]